MTKKELMIIEKEHEDEWLEWKLPAKVIKKIEPLIKKEIKLFVKECGCPRCQRHIEAEKHD